MKTSLALAALLLSATLVSVSPAVSAKPDLPPLVGYCTSLTSPWCEGTACVGFSYQVPACAPLVGVAVSPVQTCVPTSGGMDYHSFLCVDSNDKSCPVYTLTASDAGVRKTCVPSAGTTAADFCVQYMYVADYHWYWICADPKGDCILYEKEQHGVTVTTRCLVPGVAVDTREACVNYANDLDYRHYVCADPGNPDCAVSTKRESGAHVTRTCVGLP